MSPEQARGEGHRLDGRSDIFSLSVILYELLTGERPFQGSTLIELSNQVAAAAPLPPREHDHAIPKQLERICLKALARRAADRYPTAEAMAEELRNWDHKPELQTQTRKIVPKGLRWFSSDDASFFLDLLPGPRNCDGLPESIAFWKSRIETRDPAQTFAVGLLYGPSGCGKSSLVKAGLLPQLSDNVTPVYAEATTGDTERQLLQAIQQKRPELAKITENSQDNQLVETVKQLRLRHDTKFVIILDQFEQWLHANPSAPDTQLVAALRHCDGLNAQAIVMVRDDFWLGISRFMDALEVELIQGKNLCLVDLFDLEHSKQVLREFGNAFGKLPEQTKAISSEQTSFLDAAIHDLAEQDRVVPVRLVLFAEMIKHRAWIPTTLDEIGGTKGVALRFLEESFGSRTANPQHRVHQAAAREVLRSLLPESNTDLKGRMQSWNALQTASGYQRQSGKFTNLLRILDSELRLITPADPAQKHIAADGDKQGGGEDCGGDGKHYQLTHDYLVPALRQWLTRQQRTTARGRTELILAERAAAWRNRPEKRQLPTFFEWLRIHRWTSISKWQPARIASRVVVIDDVRRRSRHPTRLCTVIHSVSLVSPTSRSPGLKAAELRAWRTRTICGSRPNDRAMHAPRPKTMDMIDTHVPAEQVCNN